MQVRFGRRQSVAGGEEPKAQADLASSSLAGSGETTEAPEPAPAASTSLGRAQTETYAKYDADAQVDNNAAAEKRRFAGVSRRKSISYEREEHEKTSAVEQRRERNRKKFEETELVDDILEIPELGDDGEGDITTQVAAPPKEYTQPRMQTISQLDRDVQYHLPNTAIDLSMLTMALSPADKVEEEDVPWTGETLLQELASSMDVIESASS
ncbi:intraflagellar transport protein 43 [Chloropicon roscoffensis]|uniref:Intraflagellar transport protein 43 n=1 Tax=Chloropicon roscoffensis TaxID=1461544 RepID=A0AAX4P309_9CHLO